MMGLGLYLPPDLVTGLFIGGMISVFIKRRHRKLQHEIGVEAVKNLKIELIS